MSLIKKSHELQLPTAIVAMVYGQPGTGKTTLALSSTRPLLVDFDAGVKRVNFAHLKDVDIVPLTNWGEALELLKEDLSGYDTIVVDTVGKMFDKIQDYRCGTRNPSIKDWGVINKDFNMFTRTLNALGKNIIYVAHVDMRKEQERITYVPALREKNFSAMQTDLDLLGYVEINVINGVVTRTITFDPTERSLGKNTCNLPSVIPIPTIIDEAGNAIAENDFMRRHILEPYHENIRKKQAMQSAFNEAFAKAKAEVDAISDADSANEFVKSMADMEEIGNLKALVRSAFSAKVKELKLTYDKQSKSYK